ncbi:MAG: YaaC family protein [Chitinophagaceae bacterium]|nr:YaaC family protein [Chitinophagaceae bacterium]
MPRLKSEFEDAKRDYKSVKFFPFEIDPGDPFALTSDPWFYLKAWLRKETANIKKLTAHRKKLEKALYFAELAESFQKAADSTELPTKGTLAYYSILNLVKTFLLTKDYDLESTIEYHGLSLPSDKTKELKIAPATNGNGINIFHEFAKEIGSPVQAGSTISLDDMIGEIAEVHEMCFNLGKLKTKKRKYLPIEIRILTNKDKRNKLTYEISFEKKNSNLMRTEKFDTGLLKAKLTKYPEEETRKNWCIYRSNLTLNYTHTSDSSWRKSYRNICKDIEELRVVSMLTRSGYRYYLNLQPEVYKPPVYFFSLMYYIGSVARYRPTLNAEVLEGDYAAILNEVMTTCPKQFLYFMVSKITKKVCAVPMSKID